jgi:hypothetical protein
LKITGILNKVFKSQKTLIKTRIYLYSPLALPAFIYGSENWSTKAKDARRRRVKLAEMIYMRKTAVHIWPDYKTNADFAKELNVTSVLDIIQDYKSNWI